MERIPIAVPTFGEEEYQAVLLPLKSGWVTQGRFVREFEERFAQIHGVKHAIATTSCTTALHLMLIAGGIKPGDEVIVPSFTWISTANAVKYCGATPILADIDLNTFNINVEDVLSKITERTTAVIAVHLFGLCVDVQMLREKLPKHIKVFEDAACAAGASVNGMMAGSLGEAAAFSFHPRKSITTGEGGMITTNNDQLAEMAIKLRNHGAEISEEERHSGAAPFHLPQFNYVGFNYRMTDLQAAIGVEQVKKLSRFIVERNALAATYTEALKECEWLVTPSYESNFNHAWQAYVLRVTHSLGNTLRDQVMRSLELSGISTRPGTHAIHVLGAYKSEVFDTTSLKNSELAAKTTIAIPMHNQLSKRQQMNVIENLLAIEI